MNKVLMGLAFFISLNSNAWVTSTETGCPTKLHVNSTISFPEKLGGYGYTAFEVAGNLREAYATVLKAGKYQLTALMVFERTKKVKGKLRCLYSTEGIVVKGSGFIEKYFGRRSGKNTDGWIQLDEYQKITRVSVATIYMSSVHDISAKDGNLYPTLYISPALTLYGNKVLSSANGKTMFLGTLTEIDYSAGHRDYATAETTLTSLD